MSVRTEILQFLRTPRHFAQTLLVGDEEVWLKGYTAFARVQIAEKNDPPLMDSQVAAWSGLASCRVGLIQGPPGTGKTHVLSWMALGYLQARRAAGLPCRIFVTAFTLNAIGNLLDSIQAKATRYLSEKPTILYLGNDPAGGIDPAIRQIPVRNKNALQDVWKELKNDNLIVGCSVWALNRVLSAGGDDRIDGPTAPLFHLVCIDEASQMVVSSGLMALAGLTTGGRVLVAGDDKQLPPVRAAHAFEVEGRRLGGSLYDFLKSSDVAEFPLEETFRLNGPLTRFPEAKFYPGHYRSAGSVTESRLVLRDGWDEGLEPWERVALDPQFPLCVLLHDGPPAGTSNPFEVMIASRLAKRLCQAMAPADADYSQLADAIWQDRLAVISPHRAQNAAIRSALAGVPFGKGAVVETVDKIQGKERDAVIASYTVSDPEFALAEAEFIFSVERLNVTITRARTKLVLIVSRRLLDAVPVDDKTLDAAQILRELAFDSDDIGTVFVRDTTGSNVAVNVRVRGFPDSAGIPTLVDTKTAPDEEPLPELSTELEEILVAIRDLAISSPYGTAAAFDIKKRLFRSTEVPLKQLRDLVRLGHIRLEPRTSKFGTFWVAKPLDPARAPFPGDPDTVKERLEEVISTVRSGRHAPFYTSVRDRFVWMDLTGEDRIWPVVETMAREGVVKLSEVNGSPTIEWVQPATPEATTIAPTAEPLSDLDFEVLNHLEDHESSSINFGVTEGWTSLTNLSRALHVSREVTSDALRRLQSHGHLLMDEDGRIRSRMAELAREVRYVKQRFAVGDLERSPHLVRSLKIEIRNRDKPVRDRPLSTVIADLVAHGTFNDSAKRILAGFETMLRAHWDKDDPLLAGFQARAIGRILNAWVGRDHSSAFVVTADTGSGKTEAACFPLMIGAAFDSAQGIHGTRAVLVYPRVRLAANQAQRIAGYLAAMAQIDGMPPLTIGLQNWQVPTSFDYLDEAQQKIWRRVGPDVLTFPFFGCPDCGGNLFLHLGNASSEVDRLNCTQCQWAFSGWVGSKASLRRYPPTFFLPVTESLHQWQHDSRYGALFGDVESSHAPRALLADEIHLYTHIHGAQVGYALRRLLARAQANAPTAAPPLAIGMSATLGNPALVWGELIGRQGVVDLRPEPSERRPNPRGREYFYFIQPEVESRGKDIAGASTTIQSLMCLAHGMRRRTGQAGGYRAIAFLDSIDKLKRLHGDYQDAEEAKRLAALRTRLFDDDPGATHPRRECCGQPATCDRFRQGECWYFAATDQEQVVARGRYIPGNSLTVADRPVFSGTGGNVEDLIRNSDIVFSTSSLEVGYDDPDMALVYQHYAPTNLASFIQRKGRGGRGIDDRPVTAVTLSPYSPRDSWYYRRPHRMLDSAHFEIPLNIDNYFVRRGQVFAALLDSLAHWQSSKGTSALTSSGGRLELRAQALEQADRFIVAIFGEGVYAELGYSSLLDAWRNLTARLPAALGPNAPGSELRKALSWVPQTLFSTCNLPAIDIRLSDEQNATKPRTEAIDLAFDAATPGNITRRYGFSSLHWVAPKFGRAPWLGADVYGASANFTIRALNEGSDAFLRQIPAEMRAEVGSSIHPEICVPCAVELDVAGRMHGAGWTPLWYFDVNTKSVLPIGSSDPDTRFRVHHKSRGNLRGFNYVEAAENAGQALPVDGIRHIADRLEAYLGGTLPCEQTGLSVAALTWGADADIRVMDPGQPSFSISQTFTHPDSGQTLLHGYRVETEGVRLFLNSSRLNVFLESEIARLHDLPDGRWHKAQMFRYLIGSKARSAGINTYDANRAADLLFSASGQPALREKLRSVLKRWDSLTLRDLLLQTHSEMLAQHPLLSTRRVEALADALGDRKFQGVLSATFDQVRSHDHFSAYLRSVLVHSIAVRLKQAFVLYGRGDERRVVVHAKLPIQFNVDAEDVITVAENGGHGDGTTRMFAGHLTAMLDDWAAGALGECPNANEDATVKQAFARVDCHARWRAMDPRDPQQMAELARDLAVAPGRDDGVLQGVIRLLYGTETVGHQRVDFFTLHQEIEIVTAQLRQLLSREPSTWELVSAAVKSAKDSDYSTPLLHSMLRAYEGLEDATLSESLSAEARLSDQVFRLSARLCFDGCQGCLHGGSDLIPEPLAESALSRRLLSTFVQRGT